jgi:uncharacterized protein (DUF2249 family)
MSELVVASTEADANAAEAVLQHHAELAGALTLRVEALLTAVALPETSAAERARRELVSFCESELVPHALAEEQAMYPAARATTEGRLLVEAMLGEHQVILRLVRETAGHADLLRAAASAAALREVFDSHLAKENDLVVPLLARTPGVSLHELLGEMHEVVGPSTGSSGHSCGCGETEGPGLPELDVRTVPHAIRHATVFGALESVQPGGGLRLVAPHDPLPLLDQVSKRWPGRFSVSYDERGPQAWRVILEFTGA